MEKAEIEDSADIEYFTQKRKISNDLDHQVLSVHGHNDYDGCDGIGKPYQMMQQQVQADMDKQVDEEFDIKQENSMEFVNCGVNVIGKTSDFSENTDQENNSKSIESSPSTLLGPRQDDGDIEYGSNHDTSENGDCDPHTHNACKDPSHLKENPSLDLFDMKSSSVSNFDHSHQGHEIISRVFDLTSGTSIKQQDSKTNDCDYEPNKSIEIENQPSSQQMQNFRLVTYSDSESGNESDSCLESETETESLHTGDLESNFDEDEDTDGAGSDENTGNGDSHDTKANRKKLTQKANDDRRLRTKGEVFPEELPPLEYLTISAGDDVELEVLGTITGIVDVLVVIKSVESSPALFDDTVLFQENRQPLGLIFETMGTVEMPFYTVRFNSNDDIVRKDIKVGDKVMFAPQADNFTKYVFIAQLQRRNYVDASWESDNEPPLEARDYSDDEEERRVKKKLSFAKKKKASEESAGTKRKRRSNKKSNASVPDGNSSSVGIPSSKSSLPQGTMTRNPFGDPTQFKTTGKKSSAPRSTATFLPATTSTSTFLSAESFNNSNSFCSAPRAPQPHTTFGGKPSWQGRTGFTTPQPGSSVNSTTTNNNNNAVINPFSFVPPTFNPRSPVYNTTIPARPRFGTGVGQASGRGGGLGTEGQMITSPHNTPPTPHFSSPFASSFNNPIIRPPTFNTNIPPPPLPGMFSQFTQSQASRSTGPLRPPLNSPQRSPFSQGQPVVVPTINNAPPHPPPSFSASSHPVYQSHRFAPE